MTKNMFQKYVYRKNINFKYLYCNKKYEVVEFNKIYETITRYLSRQCRIVST